MAAPLNIAWFDALPLPLFGVALVAAFAAAAELGYFAYRRLGRGGLASETGDEGQVLSTALLLLALLLGFTFSMALGRYDERRAQVVAEANDIGTAWLRAGLAGNAAGAELQEVLRQYAHTRISRFEASDEPAAYARSKAEGARLRQRIWALTGPAVAPVATTAQAASLVSAVNAVLDRATLRETAIEARVPERVLDLLIAYAVISALLLGYVLGAYGSHHRVATLLLFVLLAMTIVLILDLDQPQAGGIRVNQQAMIDLAADLDAGAAGPQGRK